MTTNKRRPRMRRSNTPPPPSVGERRPSQLPIPPPGALPREALVEEDEQEDEAMLAALEPTPALPPVAPRAPSAPPAPSRAPTPASAPPPPAPVAEEREEEEEDDDEDDASPEAPAAPAASAPPPHAARADDADEDEDEDGEEDGEEEANDEDEQDEEEDDDEQDEQDEDGDEDAHDEAVTAKPGEVAASVRSPGEAAEVEAERRLDAPTPPPSTSRWLPIAALAAVALGVFLWVRMRREPPRPPVLNAAVSASAAPVPPRLPTLSTAEPDVDRSLDDASVLDFSAAKAERKEAVLALEKHDLPKALDLATQAIGHDPQDAEGWLILGAAQIYRGDFVASQKAFKSCVEQAKVGRRDECAALMR